ncbi:MAG: PAS-domain containing protein [Methylococcaceae bacterium]|nr:PAS-domain containing protein [Methylococcaceae bacterium]
MKTLDRKRQSEIEIERLWAATGLGKSGSLSIMPFYFLIVAGLWDKASHEQLLVWLFISTATNLFRWYVLHYYRAHKEALSKNTRKFKNLILFGGVLIGLNWVLCFVLFQDLNNPDNFLIICFPTIFQVLGTMVTWFSYYPAVVAVSLPPTLTLIYSLIQLGGKANIILAFMFSILPLLSYVLSVKLSKMLDYALQLNFENAALRRESEEKSILLETALENMGQGISMSDKEDRLRMWNTQFTKLLGTAGTLVKADANLKSILNQADPPLPVSSKDDTTYRLPNGHVYEIRQSELSHGGRVITYTDISNLIKREQALEKARKDAEKANAAKTRFLAAASHDLRQPIHALGLFFAELSDRVKTPETALVIGQIDDSISAINSMLNALLDISKLDAGVVQPNLETCHLKDIFHRLKTDFQPIALENHNELRIRPSLATVTTDPVMLERMLRNLIGNALRYTENGRILVAARQRRDQLEIQIFDNGAGIPKDQLEEVFIEFHQLQNPARDRRRGLGLGLAIVKRLAKLLDHKIKVVSQFGRGSCFSITLPLATVQTVIEQVQPIETAYVHNFSLEGRQILVLDDDISVLEGMYGLLTHWGCQVITAGTPFEAVDKVAHSLHKPEVLIIDYRLTDNISGIDVAINLQKRFGYSIAVLIITGDTGPERLREADASGFPLLHKPVQPAKLRSTLHYLISKGVSKPD